MNNAEYDSITSEGLRLRLKGAKVPILPRFFECVQSTNLSAKELAQSGAAEGTVVFAYGQRAGRGRLGRSFASPKGTGLYMSLVLRPKLKPEETLTITTAAAVAVCEAIETVSGIPCGIKWVNDVFIGRKKVCGILTESTLAPGAAKPDFAVLGIGVNVSEPPEGFGALSDVACALYKVAPKGTTDALAAEILTRFYGYYTALRQKTFLPSYRRRSVILGKEVTVISGERRYAAVAREIDDNLNLRVALPDGSEKSVSSGEVSVQL